MSSPKPSNRRRPNQAPPGPDDSGPLPTAEVDAADPTVRARVPERESHWKSPGFLALVARTRRVASATSVVLLLAGSAVGGRWLHRWITHTPRFGAREIEVSGLVRTSREAALAAAGVAPGINVLGLDTTRAERSLRQLPWVQDATVSRRLPGWVRVELVERTAAALVSAQGLYLCASDGTVFKRLRPGDPDDLPIVTGIARQDFERDPDAAEENVRDALALLADLDASSLAGRVHVDEVHRDATGDLSIVLAGTGTYVWLGRGPYRAKLARLSAILSELDRQHIAASEVHLESDRHPERATVRLPPDAASALLAQEAQAAAPRPESSASSSAEAPVAHEDVGEGATLVSHRHRRH